LSELKIFIKRAAAEKLVDLESGDKIEVKGKVFSNALGDAWMDANEVKNLSPKPIKKP
jgi:lysyl-tRNA synthetase class II